MAIINGPVGGSRVCGRFAVGLATLLATAAVGCGNRNSGTEFSSEAATTETAAQSALITGDNDTTDETSSAGASGEIPVLGQLPQFELIEHRGHEFTNEELNGKIWIAHFFFTRCQVTCPEQLAQMVRLADSFRDKEYWTDLRLVNFSVDPEYDTLEVLQRQAESLDATTPQWLFVTGNRSDLWSLCRHGFKLPVQSAPDDQASPILHAPTFVLVDPIGRIRGYYNGLDEGEIDQLRGDVEAISSEQIVPSSERFDPPR